MIDFTFGLHRMFSVTRLASHAIVVVSTAFVMSATISRAPGAEPAAKAATADPIVVTRIPSLDRAFEDLKFVFDLAKDKDGYKTFKETLDEFLVGVDTTQPCEIQTLVTPDGLSTVVSAPVKDQAAFHKFLTNLWDLDVKTAPPPSAQQARHIPASVQKKLHAQKLEANERVTFGLADGALKFDSGHVYLGNSVNDVRMAKIGKGTDDKSTSLTIAIRGDSTNSAERHKAFQKSRQDILSIPKRDDFESQADFELAQALADYEFAKLELLVADAEEVRAAYTVSHEKKSSQFEAEVTPAKSTALAKDVEAFGREADQFAGVTQHNTVASIDINLPVDPSLVKVLKSVADRARTDANEKIDKSSELSADQKQNGKNIADLIYEVADDVSGMKTFNACLRTWADSEGKLTTVGATAITHVEQIRERIQKFQHRETVGQSQTSGSKHAIVKILNEQWKKDAPELFDSEGSVYLAVTDKALWYAVGPKALEQLEQAMQVPAKGATDTDHDSAIEIRAQLQALSQVWNAVRSRHTPSRKAKSERVVSEKTASGGNSKTGKAVSKKDGAKGEAGDSKSGRSRLADTKSSIGGLDLHKVASDAFQKEDGHFSLSLKQDGDKAKLLVKCDEGILRFVGMTLSKFTKENLADN